jgi:hypothetical protein
MQTCIPHEHHQIGNIERLHRTIQDSVVKSLHNKPHLTSKYWGMSYYDTVNKLCLRPILYYPPTHNNNLPSSSSNYMTTPYTLWFNKIHDIQDVPLLPFGQLVNAHIPLSQQTALSGRSHITYCVGITPGYKGGILLFNPTTKRCIVRRTHISKHNLDSLKN